MLSRLRGRSSPYDARLRMTGREWLTHLYGELMDRESRWMGVRALKNPLDVHDAAHEEEAVLADLRLYAPLVTPGSYLIVEDGARDLLSGLTGPVAAIKRFLQETDDFEVDESRERFLLTYNPSGFLRRRG